jgi:predicted RNA-binding protein with EMAP domain
MESKQLTGKILILQDLGYCLPRKRPEIKGLARKILHLQELSYCYSDVKELMRRE